MISAFLQPFDLPPSNSLFANAPGIQNSLLERLSSSSGGWRTSLAQTLSWEVRSWHLRLTQVLRAPWSICVSKRKKRTREREIEPRHQPPLRSSGRKGKGSGLATVTSPLDLAAGPDFDLRRPPCLFRPVLVCCH
jgi:hypothetical protein